MVFRLLILPCAVRELKGLSRRDYERVRDAIHALADAPFPRGAVKLVNREGRRIRSGSHRIIYEVNSKTQTVTIMHIGLRKDIYRVL